MKKYIFGIIFLIAFQSNLLAAKVERFDVFSNSMQKTVRGLIIKPDLYEKSETNFPVIYLLHGYSDDFTTYSEKMPKLQKMADLLEVLIVCPDGGYSSWYLDSPTDKTYRYETFISSELVSYIDKNYKTKANSKARAITGHSMGGHGAMLMAIKHHNVFGAGGSMSGGVDLTFKPKSWHIYKRLGTYEKNEELWKKNSVYHQIDLLKGKDIKLIIDCGTEDFFYEINKKLHNKMLELDIEHDFIIRPGNHSWTYWNNAIDYQFLFFYKFFKTYE